MLNYRVRPAEQSDLTRCLEVDGSYITTYVWQMQESFEDPAELELADEEPGPRPRQKMVGKQSLSNPPLFRMELAPSRLPRPLAIAPPQDDQQLLAEWKKTDLLLVAEVVPEDSPLALLEAGLESEPLFALNPAQAGEPPATPLVSGQPDILGYLGLGVDNNRHLAWITSGAVQIDYRRKGIGTHLLAEARNWADRYRLRSLLIELQIKNFPAISFFQKNGFFFCGYNNAYYADREIALFFGKRLEKFS